MKRAYLLEMTVLRDYARQLLGLGLFVSVCVSIGTRSLAGVPGLMTMMYFMMGSLSAAAYDEQNHWGLFRLTLPLSRKDIVLGRYGVIVTLGLVGMVTGFIGTFVVSFAASALPLSADIQQVFAPTADNLMGSIFAMAFCMMMGSVVAAVETPIFFRFGQTKATQWIPMVTVLLFIAPFVLVGRSGMLDSGAVSMQSIAGLLAFIETPTGLALWVCVAVAISAVALGVSAYASVKLYETREL